MTVHDTIPKRKRLIGQFYLMGDRDLGIAFQTHPESQASSPGKQRTPLSSRVTSGISRTQLSGLKGVNTPVKFGERTRNCSPGPAGKEGPHLSLTGHLVVFLELRRQCGFSHEVRWGTQGASCVVLGKSVFLLVTRGARPCSGVMVGESGIKRR